MATEVTLRKWGNSIAAIIPNEVVEQKHLAAGSRVFLDVVKPIDMSDIFGIAKLGNAQRLKDEARKGWE